MSRRKSLRLLLISVGLTGLGGWMASETHSAIAYSCAGFFGFVALVFVLFIAWPPVLTLDESGTTMLILSRKVRRNWADCGPFMATRVSGAGTASCNSETAGTRGLTVASGYGDLDERELAALLNSYRSSYRQGQERARDGHDGPSTTAGPPTPRS